MAATVGQDFMTDSGDHVSLSSPQQHEADDAAQGSRKKRVRTWTAKDRAKHRVFEKGRREAFNSSLMELARLLPSLADTKESQLSKHVIVDESIKHHQYQRGEMERLTASVEELTNERERLVTELNTFRHSLRMEPHQPGPLASETALPSPTTQQLHNAGTFDVPGMSTWEAALGSPTVLPAAEHIHVMADSASLHEGDPYRALLDSGLAQSSMAPQDPFNTAQHTAPVASAATVEPNYGPFPTPYQWYTEQAISASDVDTAQPINLPYQLQEYTIWGVPIV